VLVLQDNVLATPDADFNLYPPQWRTTRMAGPVVLA
jgi:hypothetical protein